MGTLGDPMEREHLTSAHNSQELGSKANNVEKNWLVLDEKENLQELYLSLSWTNVVNFFASTGTPRLTWNDGQFLNVSRSCCMWLSWQENAWKMVGQFEGVPETSYTTAPAPGPSWTSLVAGHGLGQVQGPPAGNFSAVVSYSWLFFLGVFWYFSGFCLIFFACVSGVLMHAKVFCVAWCLFLAVQIAQSPAWTWVILQNHAPVQATVALFWPSKTIFKFSKIPRLEYLIHKVKRIGKTIFKVLKIWRCSSPWICKSRRWRLARSALVAVHFQARRCLLKNKLTYHSQDSQEVTAFGMFHKIRFGLNFAQKRSGCLMADSPGAPLDTLNFLSSNSGWGSILLTNSGEILQAISLFVSKNLGENPVAIALALFSKKILTRSYKNINRKQTETLLLQRLFAKHGNPVVVKSFQPRKPQISLTSSQATLSLKQSVNHKRKKHSSSPPKPTTPSLSRQAWKSSGFSWTPWQPANI